MELPFTRVNLNIGTQSIFSYSAWPTNLWPSFQTWPLTAAGAEGWISLSSCPWWQSSMLTLHNHVMIFVYHCSVQGHAMCMCCLCCVAEGLPGKGTVNYKQH